LAGNTFKATGAERLIPLAVAGKQRRNGS